MYFARVLSVCGSVWERRYSFSIVCFFGIFSLGFFPFDFRSKHTSILHVHFIYEIYRVRTPTNSRLMPFLYVIMLCVVLSFGLNVYSGSGTN